MNSRYFIVFAFICLILAKIHCPSMAQEPYKLGVQENVQGAPNSNYAYPAPQLIPLPAAPAKKKPASSFSGSASQSNPASSFSGSASQSSPASSFSGNASQFNNAPRQQSFSSGVTSVALPPPFLGIWQVHGQRTSVQALPEFQAGAEQAFTVSNDQIWNISGSQGGYTLGSNTGISTALIVDKVQGNTAFVRYQHPVGKTMAQEAIVMSLLPGGMQFEGLERISIVKEGLSQPRAKVTYQLAGTRQR